MIVDHAAAKVEGERFMRKPIHQDAGYIRPHKGTKHTSGGRRLSSSETTAAGGLFLNPDGTVFYPGGTSWYAGNIAMFIRPRVGSVNAGQPCNSYSVAEL